MSFLKSYILLYFLIILVGIVTGLTDLKYKKIFNVHLIGVGVLGVMVIMGESLLQGTFPLMHLMSFIIALIVGFGCYAKNIWRGGDAKLFVMYALLMPPTIYDEQFLYPVVPLFINSFIFALLWLVPNLLIIGYKERGVLWARMRSAAFHHYIQRGILVVLAVSWVFYPVMRVLSKTFGPVLTFVVIYVFFSMVQQKRPKAQTRYFMSRFQKYWRESLGIFLLGILLRFFLVPEELSVMRLSAYFFWTSVNYLVITLVYDLLECLGQNNERVPFSPFLFAGCFLSYSSFLAWVISILPRRY